MNAVIQMRDALGAMQSAMERITKSAWFMDANFGEIAEVQNARRLTDAALSQPVRNCDRFDDYQQSCVAWSKKFEPEKNSLDGYDFAVWLFKTEAGK